jgi:YceI-like domain
MRSHSIVICCMTLLLLLPAGAVWSQIYGTNTGTVTFRSDAPLELIQASSNEMRGKFDISKRTFAFAVRINSFTGFNSPMQKEHFNENYMESVQYPNASFGGKIIEDIDFTKSGTYDVRAKGNLSVHGVVQERIIKCNLVVKDGKISIRSNFTVLLIEHNIPIPKVVHEKLASEIKVEVKVDLKPS